jgi:hypothetical protein
VVTRKLQVTLAILALVIIGLCGAALAWLRVREAREFSKPYNLRTGAGTNYVARLVDVTVGRTDTNYLLILHVRFENPNPVELRLNRKWFVLVDHDKDYHLASSTGRHAEWIVVPANGVAEREALSYTVPADTFAGSLAVELGRFYFVRLKDPEPYTPGLRDGEFVTFRRRAW